MKDPRPVTVAASLPRVFAFPMEEEASEDPLAWMSVTDVDACARTILREEKDTRRKRRNRESAAKSREKKNRLMVSLEEENSRMKTRVSELEKENAALKEELSALSFMREAGISVDGYSSPQSFASTLEDFVSSAPSPV